MARPTVSVQRGDTLHQLQPRLHCEAGGVLVSLGVAEVDEYAIAKILGNMPSKARDRADTG
jgi:hypothetical protein